MARPNVSDVSVDDGIIVYYAFKLRLLWLSGNLGDTYF